MKKFALLIVTVMIAFTGFTFGCKKNENVIRINEVTHSIFYAPFYVAINNGYFKEYGYTIELTNGGGSDASMTALLSGSADIALLGPETGVYVNSTDKKDAPMVFGQLTKKDGSFLVGKVDEPDFSWSNLAGKHVIAGRKGGNPAMSLQLAIEKNGLNINSDLNFDLSVAFNMTVGAFTGGTADYVTVFEPTASELVREKKGYIVASVGEESGEIPFTCFMANSSYIKKNPEKIENFLRAIKKAYDFIMTANIDEVVNSLRPSFSTSSDESIKASIISYKKIDAWSSTPSMSEASYNRLLDMLDNAGELSDRVPFSKVVDNSIADKIK
ncbi:MAG: ABC transporter substrate-binding protein [Christensenellales bacterium]